MTAEEVLALVERSARPQIQAALAKAGIGFATIDGSTQKDARQRAVEDFQAGRVQVFIGSHAAREGITLIRPLSPKAFAAQNTVFVERWWVPGWEEQAEDRIHRFGQKNTALITYLMAPGTIDDKLDAIVSSKRAIIGETIGTEDVKGSVARLSDAEAGGLLETLRTVGGLLRSNSRRR